MLVRVNLMIHNWEMHDHHSVAIEKRADNESCRISRRTHTYTNRCTMAQRSDTRYECLNTHLSARLHVYTHIFFLFKKTWSMNEWMWESVLNEWRIFASLNKYMNEFIVPPAIHRFGMNMSQWCSKVFESTRYRSSTLGPWHNSTTHFFRAEDILPYHY